LNGNGGVINGSALTEYISGQYPQTGFSHAEEDWGALVGL
jgi:hypothetical protein